MPDEIIASYLIRVTLRAADGEANIPTNAELEALVTAAIEDGDLGGTPAFNVKASVTSERLDK